MKAADELTALSERFREGLQFTVQDAGFRQKVVEPIYKEIPEEPKVGSLQTRSLKVPF